VANRRYDWTGWLELAKEQVDEVTTNMTAQVILDVNADIQGVVEVEDRPWGPERGSRWSREPVPAL
jgi:hypothetical protein